MSLSAETAFYTQGGYETTPLTWGNVALAALLLAVSVGISSAMKLRLEKNIIVAGCRCFVQLSILGVILKRVFATESPLFVFAMAGALGGLAALEVSRWRSKRTVKGLFWIAFFPIVGSAMVVGVVGTTFAMNFDPPLVAFKFIPVLGMTLGNTMVGVALGIDSVLAAADTRRDSIEHMMCYGAGRWEVVQPIAVEATRTAMLPSITSMGIMGLISIPGMMSGQILGGADAMNAARYQMVIAFMITASVALGVAMAVVLVAFAVIDRKPMLRPELIKLQSAAGGRNSGAGGGSATPGGLRSRTSIVRLRQWDKHGHGPGGRT